MGNCYIKKPVKIEAFQMTEERRQDNSEWPEWLNKAWDKPWSAVSAVFPENLPNSDGTDHLIINTLEGKCKVSWNDFIIQGIHGELYPCKPDIFEKTYETEEEYASHS